MYTELRFGGGAQIWGESTQPDIPARIICCCSLELGEDQEKVKAKTS